ncbi:MAG: hypothetical protein R2873_15085 [Caldilineaceae bacterium]
MARAAASPRIAAGRAGAVYADGERGDGVALYRAGAASTQDRVVTSLALQIGLRWLPLFVLVTAAGLLTSKLVSRWRIIPGDAFGAGCPLYGGRVARRPR